MRLPRLVLAIGCVLPICSAALSPASEEDVLCGSEFVVAGRVVEAEPKDCRIDLALAGKKFSDCGPKDMVLLNVDVLEVLGERGTEFPHDPEIQTGARVSLTSALSNNVRFPGAETFGRMGVQPPTESPVTREKVAEMFVGKKFIFSIHVRVGTVMNANGQIVKDYMDQPPYYTGIWRIEKRVWILQTMRSADSHNCPKGIGS